METSSPIEAVCRMADDFRRGGNLSMATLLEKSGYFEHPSAISEHAIRAYLCIHPNLIEAWVQYSLDQRVSEGWYLLGPDGTDPYAQWVVGYYPSQATVRYTDHTSACAAFVAAFVKDMREHLQNGS